MRLLVLFLATALLKQCTGGSGNKITGTIKVEFGFYCPDKTNWEYRIKIGEVDNPPSAISGKVTGNMEFRTLDNVFTTSSKVSYCWDHTCTTDGKWQSCTMFDDEHVFEKLSAHLLEKECRTGGENSKTFVKNIFASDCSDIRDRVAVYCGKVSDVTFKPKCMSSFEKALKLWIKERPVTTGESSNTTIFIIVGSVVGVVLLIALVVTYFICKRKKKKANKQTGSGMTGTGTGSKTMTKSGATKQGTTTGTFQKTGTVGTGNTGNTTTGGQRY
ncbi:unnamed protein product [Caenorhabditis brenneri]